MKSEHHPDSLVFAVSFYRVQIRSGSRRQVWTVSGVKALLLGSSHGSHPVRKAGEGLGLLTVGGGRLEVRGRGCFLRFQSLLEAEVGKGHSG